MVKVLIVYRRTEWFSFSFLEIDVNIGENRKNTEIYIDTHDGS